MHIISFGQGMPLGRWCLPKGVPQTKKKKYLKLLVNGQLTYILFWYRWYISKIHTPQCHCVFSGAYSDNTQCTIALITSVKSLTTKHPSQFQWSFWVRHCPYVLTSSTLGSVSVFESQCTFVLYFQIGTNAIYIIFCCRGPVNIPLAE